MEINLYKILVFVNTFEHAMNDGHTQIDFEKPKMKAIY